MPRRRRKGKTPNLALIAVVAIALLVTLSSFRPKAQGEISYSVGICEQVGIKAQRVAATYREPTKEVEALVQTNCCGTEVIAEMDGTELILREVQRGALCRCVCNRKVLVKNVGLNVTVKFIDLNGKEQILLPKTGFCGSSTYAFCESDSDCKRTGCSGQICAGKDESMITACEWRDCYNAEAFGLTCRCVANACQWS